MKNKKGFHVKRYMLVLLAFFVVFSFGADGAQKKGAKKTAKSTVAIKKSAKKTKKVVVGKDAMVIFTAEILNDLKDDGKELVRTTGPEKFFNNSGQAGKEDMAAEWTRYELYLENAKKPDTLYSKKLFLIGSANTERITPGSSNRWNNHSLANVRPEDCEQLAMKEDLLVEVLRPITDANFKGVMAAVAYYRSPRLLPLAPPTLAENPKIAAMQAKIDTLTEQRRRDSLAAANRPSLLSEFLSAVTVGGGIMGRSSGSETLRGLNGGFFMQDSKGISEEIGWMGLGSYTGQGGFTVYSLTSFRLSGNKESGVDFTVALGHSWFQRTDKNENVAPFRTKQYPFAGIGVTPYFNVWAPVRVTFTLNYQPEIQIYDGMTKFLDHAVSVWIKVGIRLLWFLSE